MKNFSVGQEIQVYVIGGFIKKKNNYLPVSHKNYAAFKECSLRFPPYTIPHEYLPGKSLMGFVKEVGVTLFDSLMHLKENKISNLNFIMFLGTGCVSTFVALTLSDRSIRLFTLF